MVALEKSKPKHTCPGCGQRTFVRYAEQGQQIADEVGRCDREVKCGYHLTPREYRANTGKIWTPKLQVNPQPKPTLELKEIPSVYFEQSQAKRTGNAFFNFLLSRYDSADVLRVCDVYGIGDFEGYTAFWRKDAAGSIWTAKLIKYDAATGKRNKRFNPNWMHSILEKQGVRTANDDFRRVLFGAHLLKNDGSPVAVVEAEKTAVIAALELPDFLWVSCGGRTFLKKYTDDFRAFGNRRVILFPDGDAYQEWSKIAHNARTRGFDVQVSDLLENELTDEQKANGFDLADFLLMPSLQVEQLPALIPSEFPTVLPDALHLPLTNHYAEIFAGNCKQCGDYLRTDGSCPLCARPLPF